MASKNNSTHYMYFLYLHLYRVLEILYSLICQTIPYDPFLHGPQAKDFLKMMFYFSITGGIQYYISIKCTT